MFSDKKQVIILNGAPRVGKDTFIDECTALANLAGIPTQRYSSIDEIKDIAAQKFRWDGEKDVAGRKLLSDLKDAATVYNDLPFKLITDRIAGMNRAWTDYFLFLNIREPTEIQKLKDWCEYFLEGEAGCTTVLVRRPEKDDEQSLYQNTGDSGVYDYEYDYVVNNSGSLLEFGAEVETFMEAAFPYVIEKIKEEEADIESSV